MWRITIFTLYILLSWLQSLNFPALLENKNSRTGPSPWQRSVLQNLDQERTNETTGICLELGLPYNKKKYLHEKRSKFKQKNSVDEWLLKETVSLKFHVFLYLRLHIRTNDPGLYIRAGSRRSSPASLPGFAGYFHCFTSKDMSRWCLSGLNCTKLLGLNKYKFAVPIFSENI